MPEIPSTKEVTPAEFIAFVTYSAVYFLQELPRRPHDFTSFSYQSYDLLFDFIEYLKKLQEEGVTYM